MRVGSIFKAGVLSGLVSLGAGSCKKAPFVSMQSVPKNVVQKVDSLIKSSEKVANDTSYIFYANDTIELTNRFIQDTPEFVNNITKKARRKSPRVEIGQHLENQMIPKRGGGFDIVPVLKTDYEPVYIDQKMVVKSNSVFTRDGKDMYIPVEYYGKKNPDLPKKR